MKAFVNIANVYPLLEQIYEGKTLFEIKTEGLFSGFALPFECIKEKKTEKTRQRPPQKEKNRQKEESFSAASGELAQNEEESGEINCEIDCKTASCGEIIPKNAKNIGEVVDSFPFFYKNYIAEPKNEEAKARRFGAVALLMDFWKRNYNSPPPDFERGERGKPYFKEKSLSFSISHCEGLVCCAFLEKEEKGEIGVDIERVKKGLSDGEYSRLKSISRRFFCESGEMEISNECKEKFAFSFAELWTEKEALIKLTGEGFSAVGKTATLDAEVTAYKASYNKEDFIISVAISKEE